MFKNTSHAFFKKRVYLTDCSKYKILPYVWEQLCTSIGYLTQPLDPVHRERSFSSSLCNKKRIRDTKDMTVSWGKSVPPMDCEGCVCAWGPWLNSSQSGGSLRSSVYQFLVFTHFPAWCFVDAMLPTLPYLFLAILMPLSTLCMALFWAGFINTSPHFHASFWHVKCLLSVKSFSLQSTPFYRQLLIFYAISHSHLYKLTFPFTKCCLNLFSDLKASILTLTWLRMVIPF